MKCHSALRLADDCLLSHRTVVHPVGNGLCERQSHRNGHDQGDEQIRQRHISQLRGDGQKEDAHDEHRLDAATEDGRCKDALNSQKDQDAFELVASVSPTAQDKRCQHGGEQLHRGEDAHGRYREVVDLTNGVEAGLIAPGLEAVDKNDKEQK